MTASLLTSVGGGPDQWGAERRAHTAGGYPLGQGIHPL